ncbi:MAG TPA: hypothetical protein VGQ83_15550 [Polyangia bacterium]
MSRGAALAAAAVLGLGAAALACTDASLYGYDREPALANKLVVSGDICTEDPTERGFPVKVLFLVDTSVTDPAPPTPSYGQQRGDSVEKVVRTYGGLNYSYGIIRYAGPLKGTNCGIKNLTPDGFSKFVDDAIVGVRCSEQPYTGRDIMSALSLASSTISGDVLHTDKGLRARTKYVVVLLANGPPTQSLSSMWCMSQTPKITDPTECSDLYTTKFCGDMQPPPADCERALYIKQVRDMKQFAIDNGAQELWFHTIYQRDPGNAAANTDDGTAVSLLTDLAIAGEGSLYMYPQGTRPTPAAAPATGVCGASDASSPGCLFAPINFDSTQSVYLRKEFIVANRNAQPTPAGIVVDSDGDGLPDDLEIQIGTDPLNPDTDGDHLSDLTEYLMRSVGLDPLRTNLPPCTPKGTPPNTVGGCCPAGGCPPDPAPRCDCAPDCALDANGVAIMKPSCVDPNATPETLLPWPPECSLPQTYLPNAFPPDRDRDGDGLTDCEELLLRTDPTLLDSDADGLPDFLEFKYGTNPLAGDALGDLDADGASNKDETRWHTDPAAKDVTQQEQMSYRYHFTDAGERDLVSFSQPINATGVVIKAASQATQPGPAKLLLNAPGDCGPGQPETWTLNWVDPKDVAAAAGGGVMDPCSQKLRDAAVPVPTDGVYTIDSLSSDPGVPEGELSITVEIISVLFPTIGVQDNIRLSASRRFCFNFRVSNITLVPTRAEAQFYAWDGGQWNRVDPPVRAADYPATAVDGDTVEITGGANAGFWVYRGTWKKMDESGTMPNHGGWIGATFRLRGVPYNYIDVFFGEVPKNNASSYGVFRVATIPISYQADPPRRTPPDAEIVLTFDDFLPFGE